jgi:hypothetical protein
MIAFVAVRKIIKLAVTEFGKDAIEEVAQKYDMKEYAVAGKIYEWFVRQDDLFQRAVLGMLGGLEVDAAAQYMRRLAEQGRHPPPTDHIRHERGGERDDEGGEKKSPRPPKSR